MQLPAALRRTAIIAKVMVERALPAVLELASGHEDDVGVLEARHIAAEVAAVPRRFHAARSCQGSLSFPLWTRRTGEREEGDQASQLEMPDDDGPAMAAEDHAVTLEPAVEQAGASARLNRGESVRASRFDQ